jgi:hypothetical protein
MKSENRIEEKIDVVRDKLCTETAHMSRTERTAYFRTLADRARKEFGISDSGITAARPPAPRP